MWGLGLSPISDRLGRRTMIIICVTIFGVFSLGTAWAHSFLAIAILRFLTGLGTGAALFAAVALPLLVAAAAAGGLNKVPTRHDGCVSKALCCPKQTNRVN